MSETDPPPSGDHLSNEVSLDVRLEQNGLTAKARSRTAAAIDRLGGALFDLPTPYLEALAQKRRARTQVEVEAILAGSEQPPKLEKAEGPLLLEHLSEAELREQINKKKVVESAVEYLQATAETSESQEQAEEQEELDPDWLNYFEFFVEKATSDRMRDLWARVLAKKIRSPRHYSLTTLRFLSELDPDIAQTFEKYARHHVSGHYIAKGEGLRGERLRELTFLEEVGLLQGVTGGIGLTFTRPPDGKPWIYPSGDLLLLVDFNGNSYRLNVISISRTGREILSLMAPASDMEILEDLAEKMKNGARKIQIAHITSRSEDGVRFNVIRVLKDETNEGA